MEEKAAEEKRAASANFKEHKCELFTLTNYDILIQKAVEENYVREEDLETLLEWKKDPQAWSDMMSK